ncbi:MAG: ABC transporter permease [Armatimonadetes bacterium]|nr:ABC transporter permease [Armatimonadota bacterium]
MNAIVSIARTTFAEAIRRKVLFIIFLIGVTFLAVAPGLNVLSARQERTVLVGFTLGVIQLTSALIAIVLTVYLIPNEIERRTIYTILCKPVRRWQFFVGKYLGAVTALGVMMAAMTVLLIIVFALQQGTRDPAQLAPLAKGPLMFFFQMSLLAAVAMCLSAMVQPILNFFLTGGIYLVGTLFGTIFETFQENRGVHPVTKAISQLVMSILPNFGKFNVQNPLINPNQQIGNESMYYIGTALYGVVYIIILLLIGILVFERKEV